MGCLLSTLRGCAPCMFGDGPADDTVMQATDTLTLEAALEMERAEALRSLRRQLVRARPALAGLVASSAAAVAAASSGEPEERPEERPEAGAEPEERPEAGVEPQLVAVVRAQPPARVKLSSPPPPPPRPSQAALAAARQPPSPPSTPPSPVQVRSGAVLMVSLPNALAVRIFSLLDDGSLLRATLACRCWADICRFEPALRKRIERQVVRELPQQPDRSANILWMHLIYMWEARWKQERGADEGSPSPPPSEPEDPVSGDFIKPRFIS